MLFIRATTAFLGLLLTLSALASLLTTSADLTLWWFDLRPLPAVPAHFFLALAGLLLTASPFSLAHLRLPATITLALLSGVAALNTLTCLALFSRGSISSSLPIPLSLLLSVGTAALARATLRTPITPLAFTPRTLTTAALTFALWATLLPLAQMLLFGHTDYHRTGDLAVVLGARTYADGTPSDALKDRVTTACALYRQGKVSHLLLSGGPGDAGSGEAHETAAMRRLALSLGVPSSAILLDTEGLNTAATARHTANIARQNNFTHILLVTHAYHLPRTKLACEAEGLTVTTVPAKETYLLSSMPKLMAREVAAWWVYWGRSLA